MVKKFLPILSVMLLVGFFGSASAQWKFVKYFPNDSLSMSTGMNNTIAVDPAGRVWIVPYTGNTDSIMTSAGTYAHCWDIFVYNPDGTLYKKYGPVLNFNGTPDTLFTAAAGYGMAEDPTSGNIIICKNSLTLRKINYQTGAEIAKIVDPLPGYSSSMDSPAVDSLGEVFEAPVVPTTGVGPSAISSDLSSVLIAVDTSTYGSFSRNLAVTPSGNDVYVGRIALGTFHYHSDNGTLGPYVFVDTLFKNLVDETAGWQPHSHMLYVGSGNVTSGMPNPPYLGYRWYGFDMSNPDQPVLKDSIVWNGNYDTLQTTDPRPRGIAFSPSGDTAYVAAFNSSTDFIQMFVNSATPVVERPAANVPTTYSLSQNYPNPFNPTTRIDYALKATGNVSLIVYDVLGREVATLANGVQAAGQHSVTFNASSFASGVYFYSLTTPDGLTITKKMILMK